MRRCDDVTSNPAHGSKVFLGGTHRVRHPQDTWDLVRPLLPRFGITRVADVTGLDVLGIPVVMAVRPLAKSLSVSQGKGRTTLLARVSAVMESIELWHAEHAQPHGLLERVAAADLDLPYAFDEVVTAPGALIGARTPVDWAAAGGVLSAQATWVPLALVSWQSPAGARWRPPGLEWSTNGLASGNSRDEAVLHALYEIVERDAISASDGEAVPVDLQSVPDAECAALVERVRAGGARLDVALLPSRFGVPCFSARIWSDDFPVASLGWGAHSDSAVALSRAVTEAAQSRLTGIAGSREDLPALYDRVRHGEPEPPAQPAERVSWADLPVEARADFPDVGEELTWLAGRVVAVVDREPLVVDLGATPEIAVVKVVLPAAGLDLDRVHPGR
ncbi:hypothetical protein SUDANB95_04825 [Actinosynnema sp. ALI-1.44]